MVGQQLKSEWLRPIKKPCETITTDIKSTTSVIEQKKTKYIKQTTCDVIIYIICILTTIYVSDIRIPTTSHYNLLPTMEQQYPRNNDRGTKMWEFNSEKVGSVNAQLVFENSAGLPNEPAKGRSEGQEYMVDYNGSIAMKNIRAGGAIVMDQVTVVMYEAINDNNINMEEMEEERRYYRADREICNKRKYHGNTRRYNKDSVNDGKEHEGNDI